MSAVPVARTYVESRPHLRVVTRPQVSIVAVFGKSVATFMAFAAIAFLASSLWGNVMVESARRDALRASERMRAAKAAEAALQQQVEALTRTETVVAWGKANGFLLSNELGQPSVKKDHVAQRN